MWFGVPKRLFPRCDSERGKFIEMWGVFIMLFLLKRTAVGIG